MITHTFEYQEEDGFFIIRGDNEYRVYGSAKAEYSYTYTPGYMYAANGDPGYPEEKDLECESFTCHIESIYNEDDTPADIELTKEESESFEIYMFERLNEIVQDTDWVDIVNEEADARAEAEWEENHESI